MRKDYCFGKAFAIRVILIALSITFCKLPYSRAELLYSPEQTYMWEWVEGDPYDCGYNCAIACTWDNFGYDCDGNVYSLSADAQGCAYYGGETYWCDQSCPLLEESLTTNNPLYNSVPCPIEENSCQQVEGQCCPDGVPPSPQDKVGNPINFFSGNNIEEATDLGFSSPHEQGFKFYRTYKSRSSANTTLGYGWVHNYSVSLFSYGGDPRINSYEITDESGRSHKYRDPDNDSTYVGFMGTMGTLVKESDGSFTWHRANGVRYTFDSTLQYIAKEDGVGNVQTLSYNANGQLESVTDEATGRAMGFLYNADGRIEYITGPVTTAVSDGVWVHYQYDTDGNLEFVTYADDANGSAGSGFEYKYEDPNDIHNLTEKRNGAGEFISSWQYDAQDRAWKNVNREGKGVEISYSLYEIVVTDAQGVERAYTIESINARNTITNISGSGACASCGGDIVRYGYDDQRRVNEVEYANGRIDRYTDFDTSNRYQTEIQAVGTADEKTVYYTYHPDTGDRLTITEASILGTGNKETIFDYDNDGNATPNENPTRLMRRRIESGFTYDSAGQVVGYDYVTTLDYNAKGQVLWIDGPLDGDQDKISFVYDPVTGDLLSQTLPLSGTISYTYDAAGNVATITDLNNIVTTITYDGRNRPLSVTRNGIATSLAFTAAGEVDEITDALNRVLDFVYNPAGFLERIVDPNDNYTFNDYNALGQLIEASIYDATGTRTLYRAVDYGDPAANPDLQSGKPWKTIRRNADDTADLETVFAYDASGNLKAITDAATNSTAYTYDLFDRLETVTQPGDVVTTYRYDAHGNLASITDAEGHATLYVYDDMGRMVQTDSTDTGITAYAYDKAGNLRFKTRNDTATEYQYDVQNRLTHIFYADASYNVTLTYDSGAGGANLSGRLASVTDRSGFVEYSYDDNGNVEMETRTVNGVAFVTGYGYDDAGNLRSVAYPSGHMVQYRADIADPALVEGVILDSAVLASGITYAPFGPVTAMTLANGVQVTRSYDKNYQVRTMAAGTVLDRAYTPDAVGNIELITDNLDSTRSQSFGYDALYRLTNATGVYGTIDFTYDKVGNRQTRTRAGASPAQDTYSYEPGTNLLKTVVGTHAELLHYDADGNTKTRTPGANNPTPAIADPADYIYNTGGQRQMKQNSSDRIFHYDLAGRLLAETDGLGNLVTGYIWLHGQPFARFDAGGQVYYYHNDHLGTPQRMTDSSGTVVWSADYLPFGQADVTVETVVNDLRFAGQYYDHETGLHYNYHRYYDPSLGRYLRADPIGLEGGINLYAYVQNNPLNWIDPRGLRIQIKGGQLDQEYTLNQLSKFIRGDLYIDENGVLSRSPSENDGCIEAYVDELIQSDKLYRIFNHLNPDKGWGFSATYPTNEGADIYFDPHVNAWYPSGAYSQESATPASDLAHELIGRGIQIERGEPHGRYGTETRKQSNKRAVERANPAYERMGMKRRVRY